MFPVLCIVLDLLENTSEEKFEFREIEICDAQKKAFAKPKIDATVL